MYENTKGRIPAASMELTSTAKTKFDEFLRRQLGVTDARDPKSVVNALRKLYPTTASRLDDESRGQAIRVQATPEPAVGMMSAAMDSPALRRFREQREALAEDLELAVELASNRDFKALVSGWRDSILAEVDEGEVAANQAVDPVARDRTFYSVRKLGDCARVGRMVGMINPTVSPEFGRLASTLDESSMLLRVLAGEALFRAGFDRGGNVFQVALTELRQRREALIHSLEQLTSTGQGGQDGANDWGDGPASYGRLLERLRAKGHADLRAVVRPEAMSRLLDVLLNHVPRMQSQGLRSVASTVPMELLQLRRLRDVAVGLMDTSVNSKSVRGLGATAPLVSFTENLTLFISAFERPNAGARLLNLVLPAPLAFREQDGKELALNKLFSDRALVQQELDELQMDPTTTTEFWEEMARLDRKLYHTDRIIDLYLLDYDEAAEPGDNRVDLHEEMLHQLDDVERTVFELEPVFRREQCGLEEDALELAKSLTQGSAERVGAIEKDRRDRFGVLGDAHCNTGEEYQPPPPERVSLDRLERHFLVGVGTQVTTGPQTTPSKARPPRASRPAVTDGTAPNLDEVSALIQQNRAQIMTELEQRLEAQGPELARQLEQAFADQLKAVERLLSGRGAPATDDTPQAINGISKEHHSRRHARHPRKT